MSKLSLRALRRMLRETEQAAGSDSQAAHLLRRVIRNRESGRHEVENLADQSPEKENPPK